MSLLACYYASTIAITKPESSILRVLCSYMNEIKSSLISYLFDKNEEVEEFHENLISGFFTLFSSVLISDNTKTELFKDIDLNQESEQKFLQLIVKFGEGFLKDTSSIFGEDDDYENDDEIAKRFLPILYSVTFVHYWQYASEHFSDIVHTLFDEETFNR